MENTEVGLLVVRMIIGISSYIFTAYALQVIANKTNTSDGWMAWIPIFNLILMIRIAGVSGWYFFLMLIPLVNIYFCIKLLVGIAHARGRSGWFAVPLLLPVINLFGLGVLAFSDPEETYRFIK